MGVWSQDNGGGYNPNGLVFPKRVSDGYSPKNSEADVTNEEDDQVNDLPSYDEYYEMPTLSNPRFRKGLVPEHDSGMLSDVAEEDSESESERDDKERYEEDQEEWGAAPACKGWYESGRYELQGFTVGRPWKGQNIVNKSRKSPSPFPRYIQPAVVALVAERIRMSLTAETAKAEKRGATSMFSLSNLFRSSSKPAAAAADSQVNPWGSLYEMHGFEFNCEDEGESAAEARVVAGWRHTAKFQEVASRQDVGGAREPQSNFANNWRQRTSSELTRGEAPAHAAESEGSKGGPAPPHRSLSLSAMQQAQRASLAVGSPSYGGAYGLTRAESGEGISDPDAYSSADMGTTPPALDYSPNWSEMGVLTQTRSARKNDIWGNARSIKSSRGPGSSNTQRTPSDKGSTGGRSNGGRSNGGQSFSGRSIRSMRQRAQGNGEAYRDVLDEQVYEAEDDAFRLKEGEDALRVGGKAVVGATLMAVVPRSWISYVQRGNKCFIQWFRCKRGSAAEKVAGATYAKYQITNLDKGCRMQLVAAMVQDDGGIGSAMSYLSEWVVQETPRERRRRRESSERRSHAGSRTRSTVSRTKSISERHAGGENSVGSSHAPSMQESETTTTLLTSSPVQIVGEAVVGETLLVAAPEWSSMHKEGLTVNTSRIQWLRGHKDRSGRYNFTKVVGAKTPRYLLTEQDLNCRLRVVAAPILENGLVGKAWTTLSQRVTQRMAPIEGGDDEEEEE
mmetsp:Transcript_43995/g.84044  ORF Transcript_43995/g.84044 Transcript_43995/m.84044 type:complete len:732 (+) Transcript_43995:424-2619(+)